MLCTKLSTMLSNESLYYLLSCNIYLSVLSFVLVSLISQQCSSCLRWVSRSISDPSVASTSAASLVWLFLSSSILSSAMSPTAPSSIRYRRPKRTTTTKRRRRRALTPVVATVCPPGAATSTIEWRSSFELVRLDHFGGMCVTSE